MNSGCFQPDISQNVAKSIPSPTSQLCGDSVLSVCLSWQDDAIYRPPGHLQALDRLMEEASVKEDYITFGYYSTHMSC